MAHKGVKLISDGKYVEGLSEMSKLVQSLSKALENCSNVDSDLTLIQSWLSILSQPEMLTKALEENWKVNQEMIKTGVEFL